MTSKIILNVNVLCEKGLWSISQSSEIKTVVAMLMFTFKIEFTELLCSVPEYFTKFHGN